MTGDPGEHSRRPQRMSRAERHEAITAHVLATGAATPGDLAAMTGASLMTVHRDLDELARQGVLRKFHGGVSAQPSSVFEASSAYRANVQLREKEALGEAAARRMASGMSVMLDTSTTNLHVVEHLLASGERPLTVITNYLPIMHRLHEEQDIRLIGVGGDFNRTHQAFLGRMADSMVEGLSADIAFLSTAAMTAGTTYHQETDIVASKQAMMRVSDHTVLLMDPTKIRRRALHRLSGTAEFDELLLTDPDDQSFVDQVSEQVSTEIIAPLG